MQKAVYATDPDARRLLTALRAFRRGDFSVRISDDLTGLHAEIADEFNEIVRLNQLMTREFRRLSTAVGKEGKIGERGELAPATGEWKSCIASVNTLIGDLVQPTTEVARVIGAVARGDLSQTMMLEIDGRPLRGEFLRIGKIVNTMVGQLGSFASEVTRVAREVGTEGKLGGQARVKGVAGTWKDLTDNVNLMAANLTAQVRNIADVTTAVARGDLSRKITVDVKGEILELKNTINTMVDQLGSFASEVTRVAREVGTEGKLGGQARVEGVAGTWKDLTDNVNAMATNLTGQVRNIAEVTTAVAKGDLSKKITVDVKGEILQLKNTINTMVDQLNSFASEVTRVAREVGTEGNLGGQARVEGVAGTWKDLTDNVNMMATNLTNQVRGIAEVVTAVAQGNLKRKLAVEAKGEIAALANTINFMIETLAIFADQVTNVAREVGIEGKLGGQAKVPGAAGLWRDLTDNVNQLAENLTTQVRAIAEVATAVTKGDLTRSITVQTRGEVAVLKDNINEMIRNLKDTTQKNKEQDWLKTNLARFSRMLQGERDLNTVTNLILSELTPLVNAQYAVFYVTARDAEDEPVLELAASYAAGGKERVPARLEFGQGLVGQCARDKRRFLLTNLSSDYLRIGSSLGEAAPANVIVLPVLFEGEIKAVIELASFSEFNETHKLFLDQLMESIGIVLNTIAATMRTEGLLSQSQLLTQELQSQQEELKKTNDRLELQATSLRQSEELLKSQQEELRQTNEQLHEKALLLSMEKKQVEAKNLEVEMAKSALEEKAEQLALTSKYKSEFLANMSHELRTPLNSLLILSKMLAENIKGNLTEQQIEFSRTIHAAGTDLLGLINDILDLSKIESGTVSVEIGDVSMHGLRQHMERTFTQLAADKGLSFLIDFSDAPRMIKTDEKRLQQIVMNLISNAVKFTHEGEVRLEARIVSDGWSSNLPVLKDARQAIAITVTDTGIGIPEDKQKIIFEAFQQADGTTSRKYGGTGLGLSISREIARLLGGEIQVVSQPNKGSRFTLYLPLELALAYEARHDWAAGRMEEEAPAAAWIQAPEIADDRDDLKVGDPTILIVDGEFRSATAQMAVARGAGFRAIVALRGTDALAMARRYNPDIITLKLPLPDFDGLVLLDQIKHDADIRHLPVHVITGPGEAGLCREIGAVSIGQPDGDDEALHEAILQLKRLRTRPPGSILLMHRNPAEAEAAAARIASDDLPVDLVHSPHAALERLQRQAYAAVILEPAGIDGPLYEHILSQQQRDAGGSLPLLLYSVAKADRAGQLWREKLRSLGAREATAADLATILPQLLQDSGRGDGAAEAAASFDGERDHILRGSKVLIVDDDIRNIFSMTSILEQHHMRVVHAENGRAGIEALRNDSTIELALIDIMMPEMDGYQTMQVIRQHDELRDLPLIAVTAKAMVEDRQKCIEAGASDYVSKPVDIDLLLSMIRTWLLRRRLAFELDLGDRAETGERVGL